MRSQFSRRDFLELLPQILISPFLFRKNYGNLHLKADKTTDLTNVIIILFDALSARHLSLYDYPRKTSPNFEKFAQHSYVFHSHYSAGNFTTPGVASLLTGKYPWTHRAFNLGGLVNERVISHNLFNALGDEYFRLSFSQNHLADLILCQFLDDIDHHLFPEKFAEASYSFYSRKLFAADPIIAFKGVDDFLFDKKSDPGAFLLPYLEKVLFNKNIDLNLSTMKSSFPRGFPNNYNYNLYFSLEKVMDGVISLLTDLRTPSLCYFHFFPPHESYDPPKELIYPSRREFIGMFSNDFKSVEKNEHIFSEGFSQLYLNSKRMEYDEYVAYTDDVFGSLNNFMEQSGIIDNSIVILTSDHGQLFERGVHGHITPLLYEPVIHIPLLISLPGKKNRQDVYNRTSSIDILPTLAKLIKGSNISESDGKILPGFGSNIDHGRSIFSMEAKKNPAQKSLNIATISMIKEDYKLIHYRGYKGYADICEFYNLNNDPEEMENLIEIKHSLAMEMLDEMTSTLKSKDIP